MSNGSQTIDEKYKYFIGDPIRGEKMNNKTEICVAAADIGATHIRSAVFTGESAGNLSCDVCRKETICRDGPDGTAVTEQAVRMIKTACNEAGCRPDAIGISAAGPFSAGKNSIHLSPNMPYAEIPLKAPLEDTFSCPVFILNDASAGAYCEYITGRECGTCRNIVYLTISTGIGCGIISDGRLIEGADGNAGEIGHICVDTSYNMPCGCGGSGHWEAYASGSRMPQFFCAWCRHNAPERKSALPGTAAELCNAAHSGDPDATAFFRELAVINGCGLSTIISAYAPKKIIVDGPVATENPDIIFEPALKHIDAYLPIPEIVLEGADGMAPLKGAALFAGMSLKRQNCNICSED
jgi:glucokinase